MEFVRNLRERRGLTQDEVASKCGCHPTTVSQIENSRMLPSLELFVRLAHVLKCSQSRLSDELISAHSSTRRRVSASVTNLQAERERRKPTDH